MADITLDADPIGGFAALMDKAEEQAAEQAAEAPYGWTRDRQTGEMRPKKSAGRGGRRHPPSVDELKGSPPAPVEDGGDDAAGESAAPAAAPPAADRAPDESRRKLRISKGDVKAQAAVVVMPKQGVIASGMNRLYRRIGKIVRAMDSDVGTAILEAAKNTAGPGEPDDSVGAAWEELARTNPRIRKFIMKIIAGGAWAQLFWAHAPIFLAVLMKPAVLKYIPFARLVESMAEPDEDTPEGEGGLPGGMTADDASQMAQLAEQQFARMGLSVPPEVAGQMAQMAGAMMNGGSAPRATVRNQPRRPASRAKRG